MTWGESRYSVPDRPTWSNSTEAHLLSSAGSLHGWVPPQQQRDADGGLGTWRDQGGERNSLRRNINNKTRTQAWSRADTANCWALAAANSISRNTMFCNLYFTRNKNFNCKVLASLYMITLHIPKFVYVGYISSQCRSVRHLMTPCPAVCIIDTWV